MIKIRVNQTHPYKEVPMYTSILVPLDGSLHAEKILPHVSEMAKRFGAEVVLLKVDEPELILGSDEVVDVDRYIDQRRRCEAETEAYLKKIQGQLVEKGIAVRWRIAYGLPVKAILETAKEQNVSIVVMAGHAVGRQSLPYYGSTVAGVLQHIDRPLLLTRSLSE
jgi:nucleotide-binding universal stress UspA family protein